MRVVVLCFLVVFGVACETTRVETPRSELEGFHERDDTSQRLHHGIGRRVRR